MRQNICSISESFFEPTKFTFPQGKKWQTSDIYYMYLVGVYCPDYKHNGREFPSTQLYLHTVIQGNIIHISQEITPAIYQF